LRGTTIYVVPCVNPDLRARVFAELEGQPAPAHDGAEVELEHNFPIGWDPAAFERAGAYPLCAPESRALAEFMLGHRNIALVERFARESQRPAAAHTDAPVGDLELARALCASTGAQCVADLGPPRGAWLDFAYGQLGCSAFALVARGASASEVLPPVDALFQMARDAAPRTLRLASALPRIELGEPQVERLRGDQWQVRVAVENSGAMPTLTQLGRERLACPAPTLTLDGGRVLAAAVGEQPVARVAASIALPELAPASACTVTFFVEAPADTELVLTASAPRAGLASVRVAVR
jgi:hypothetical protein